MKKIILILVIFGLLIMPLGISTAPNPGHLCNELDTSMCGNKITVDTTGTPLTNAIEGMGSNYGVYGTGIYGIYGLGSSNGYGVYGTCPSTATNCYGIYTPKNAYVGGHTYLKNDLCVKSGSTAPSCGMSNDNDADILLQPNTLDKKSSITGSNDGNLYLKTYSSGNKVIIKRNSVNGEGKLEVDGNINVGNDLYFGTSSLLYGCTLNSNKLIIGTGENAGKLICGTDQSGGTSYWLVGTGGIYYSSGNVGIGSITAPTSKLEVSGNIELHDGNKIFKEGITGNPSIEFASGGNLIITLG